MAVRVTLAGVAVLVGAVIGVTVASPSNACRLSQIKVTFREVSAATGMNPVVFVFTNEGRKKCLLRGRPQLKALNERGAVLPFLQVRCTQQVNCELPRTLTLRPGGWAFAAASKYRCDLGFNRSQQTTSLELRLEYEGESLLVRHRPPVNWGYCGRGDPGSRLGISSYQHSYANAIGFTDSGDFIRIDKRAY